MQRFASPQYKAKMWDSEYAGDRWKTGKPMCQWPEFYEVINQYPGGLLELGCGDGLVAAGITRHDYIGLDISMVAVDQAKARCHSAGVKGRFVVGDIDSFSPQGKFRVILFGESIYYLKAPLKSIRRYLGFLEPHGVMVLSVCGSNRGRDIVQQLGRIYSTHSPTDGVLVIPNPL